MSKELTVNNITFNYPTSGDDPGWGGPATDWATEVTTVLNNVTAPDDILQTSFEVVNDQSVATDVVGMQFNGASVRSAVIDYAIYRISDSNPSGLAEAGKLYLVYDDAAGFSFGQGDVVGNAGVNFSITGAGQFQYTSTDAGSLNYAGTMKFSAKSLQQ